MKGITVQFIPMSSLAQGIDELLAAVSSTRDVVAITNDGEPTAVLMAFSTWKSMRALTDESAHPVAAESPPAGPDGGTPERTYTENEIFAMYGAPPRRAGLAT